MENSGGHLRIALVAPPYFDVPPAAYGGIEAVVADLADALVADGHAVTLIGAGAPSTSAAFVRTWDQLIPDRLGEPYPEIMNALLTRQAISSIRDQIDVVHDHTTSGPLNAAIYARWGLPTVVTMHGPGDDPDLQAFYGSLGSSIHMVAISHRQRVLAPKLNWIGTVHNALRVDQWPFQATKRGYALFLGRFSPDKGAHTALDAAHAAGIPLVLAGKCVEPIEREYFASVVEPRLRPDDVVFGLADARDKRLLLAHAQCLLFPVHWEEPFGMVMIEAMACGTPVVAMAAGAVPEVVIDGVTGFICDAADQLPAAVKAVGDLDPVACRAHVASRFSAAGLARGYADAYRRAIAATSAPRRLERRRQTRTRTHAS